ncbi:MAG: TonB-dependent receptor plug domain-containing protein, partial [Pseudoalteromonas spongiae]
MKKSLISLAVLSVVFPLSSHAAQISGQLTDNSGQPIAGVAVHVHGKEKTVTTNDAGQYQIELDADSQLHFSKDGFLDKRISVKNEAQTINFVLEKSSIEAITVYASALHKSNLDMTSPVTVLSGEELKDKSSNTLGETLNKLPGVSQTYFGPVSSSPVIRGLDGPRVRVMQNGLESSDASRVGPDHANTNETLSAEQIEVLRGPATLLYGSGAIGGVVNVVDGRIPTTNYESLEGAVEYKHDTVNEGNTTAFVLNGGDNGFNFHLDGLKRKTEDTEVPKFEAHHEDHEEQHEGEDHADEHDEEVLNSVENSFIDTTAFNLGTSYVNEHLVVGVSYGKLESDYGIPGHSHAHHDHDHEHEEEEDHGHEDEHEEHGDVFARLTQDRY